MKKRTLLAALLVVPMGIAFAQQDEPKWSGGDQVYHDISRKGEGISTEGEAKWSGEGHVYRDISRKGGGFSTGESYEEPSAMTKSAQ